MLNEILNSIDLEIFKLGFFDFFVRLDFDGLFGKRDVVLFDDYWMQVFNEVDRFIFVVDDKKFLDFIREKVFKFLF